MSKQDRPRKRVHIYLYPETHKALQDCAEEELRSVSAVIEAAARLYLDMKQYRSDPLKMLKEQHKREESF